MNNIEIKNNDVNSINVTDYHLKNIIDNFNAEIKAQKNLEAKKYY